MVDPHPLFLTGSILRLITAQYFLMRYPWLSSRFIHIARLPWPPLTKLGTDNHLLKQSQCHARGYGLSYK